MSPGTDPAAAERGAGGPSGWPGRTIAGLALAWSLGQLWHVSPLPFALDLGVLNSTEARALHLGFAIVLAYLTARARRRSPRERVPWTDVVLALVAGFAATYVFWFYDALAERPGSPLPRDIAIACVGLVLLLEAARRTLGLPLVAVALVFLGYVFFGDAAFLPDVVRWQGASLGHAMSHQWLTTEGVYGIALGVSTSFVFLFVLFGALLEQAGAGQWFIRLAFALLGTMRGGPAKAAVVASGMTGVISGSSIANVVTTGTFTIPLMRRVGFSRERAGAVEVASSVNGQLTPPVMGAAAFLMVEYVGISYIAVIKHALLPALISYAALLYMVHLEAVKAGMQGLPRRHPPRPVRAAIGFVATAAGLVILAAAVYWGIGWIRTVAGDAAIWIVAAGLVAAYVAMVHHAARFPAIERSEPDAAEAVPDLRASVQAGLHYLLPVVLLVWCLVVERFSPGLSAFWATAALIAIVVTQRPLLAWFRNEGDVATAAMRGGRDLVAGLIGGARNMIGIGIATATAGIVVGTVTLTGIGQVMTEFVGFLSGGQLFAMLLLTAVMCLVLGMGLPTTANYIVVSSLMAPVVVTLAGEQGLVVPLIAVHMFVFYFGIMADVTPPVGLAAFAAAAVSGGDAIRTGVRAFWYSLRTVVLPFMFLFNPELLLIGIQGPGWLALTVAAATAGMLVLAAALQGWLLRANRAWETVALLLVAFTMFRPGFWMDRVAPPYADVAAAELERVVEAAPAGAERRLVIERRDYDGDARTIIAVVNLGPKAGFDARLRDAGLVFVERADGHYTAEPALGGPLDDARYRPELRIERVRVPRPQPPEEWFYLPAVVLLGGVVAAQAWRGRASGRRHGR